MSFHLLTKNRDIILVLATVFLVTGGNLWLHRDDPKQGYEVYDNFNIKFIIAQENQWETGVDDDGVFDYTGQTMATDDRGMVGYNIDSDEIALTWVSYDSPPTIEEILELHFTSVHVNAERRDRGCEITQGETEYSEKDGHSMAYQFHQLRLQLPDMEDPIYATGIIGGWYCEDTGRAYLLYVYRWGEQNADKDSVLKEFQYHLRILQGP